MNQNQTQPQNDENTNNPPKTSLMGNNNVQLIYDHGFWRLSTLSPKVISDLQAHFQARDTDILIVSLPKSGTTWLKALVYAIVNRVYTTQVGSTHPLLAHNPHELVPWLEGIYSDGPVGTTYPRPHHLDEMTSPRLFQTHLPYFALAHSIKSSACKIVYICRNPLDVLVSQWNFFPIFFENVTGEEFKSNPIEDHFEEFCRGTIPYGPYFEHVLEYWNLSLERSDNVLFLKYEDLKDDPKFHLKRLAEFVGFPFSIEEEDRGVIEEIIQLCSIQNLKELDVNKSGIVYNALENKSFFRKGQVGDWKNYFTPTMVDRMTKLMEEKFKNTGLSFKLHPN